MKTCPYHSNGDVEPCRVIANGKATNLQGSLHAAGFRLRIALWRRCRSTGRRRTALRLAHQQVAQREGGAGAGAAHWLAGCRRRRLLRRRRVDAAMCILEVLRELSAVGERLAAGQAPQLACETGRMHASNGCERRGAMHTGSRQCSPCQLCTEQWKASIKYLLEYLRSRPPDSCPPPPAGGPEVSHAAWRRQDAGCSLPQAERSTMHRPPAIRAHACAKVPLSSVSVAHAQQVGTPIHGSFGIK